MHLTALLSFAEPRVTPGLRIETKKLLRVMKLTAIILLSACLTASAKSYSQRISLNEKNVPIQEIFKKVWKQTGYQFVYTEKTLAGAKPVTIQVKNGTIDEVLELCFRQQPFTYTISNNAIIVKPKEEKSSGHSGLDPESFSQLSQPIDITGRVTDENGNPLSGASVKVKGSSKGTTTNNDGVFVLKDVNDDAVLEISYVGFELLNVPVNNRTAIVTSLKQKPENLNEVVINKGYYTERQITSTSNVFSVKSNVIEKQPVNNPLLTLQGRVPSLIVTQGSGFAGSGVRVQVQGALSIGQGIGTDPLYIVDGVPYPSRSLYTLNNIQQGGGTAPNIAGLTVGTVNPLSFINPADIESIDILKDADATAIYGSRAANGAILITTKKGKAGRTKVTFNLQTGAGKVGHFIDVLNRDQYLQMRHEAFKNDGTLPGITDYDLNGTWDTTRSTDWQKELIGGTARYTDIQADVSGGTANTQFLIGTGYHKETTVFPGNLADQRGSLHFNINNVTSDQKFRLQFSGSYMADNNKLMQTDLTALAVTLSPIAPKLYNDDGSLDWAPASNGNSSWVNPLAFLYNEYGNKTNTLVSNFVTSYQILKGLELKSSFGYNNLQSVQYSIKPLQAIRPESRASNTRSSQFITNNTNNWIIEPSLDYKFSLSKLKVATLIGSTFLETNNNFGYQTGSGYSSDLFMKNIGSAASVQVLSGLSQYKYNALFGRVSGNWNNKYIINLTARRDGSSRFGSENLFHNFASVAGAWVFSQESFITNSLSFLSFGKLRASYGTTGNDQIGDYRFLNLYNSVPTGVAYQNATGISPTGLPNPYLQWEETKKTQFGLDLGFNHDKILLTANYYQNRCSNQLLGYTLPIATGFTSITRNFPATIQNYGWELSLNTLNVRSNQFNWSSNFNLTIPNNKLLSFPGIETSSYSTMYSVGQPVTISKLYHFAGIDPSTGRYTFLSANGNITSSPSAATDFTVVVTTAPKFYGGVQNTLSYKGFELDFLFQIVNQKGPNSFALLGSNVGFFPGDGTGNQPIAVMNRWQKAGDNSSVQAFHAAFNINNLLAASYAGASDKAYVDASYIRLKNASLSWQIPENWRKRVWMQDARIYAQGQNLITITKYRGMDPETLSSQSLPPLRVITVGVQVGL